MVESRNEVQPQELSQEQFEQELEEQEQLDAFEEQPEARSMSIGAAGSGLPTLRFGSSGNSVRVLQRLLVSNGYFVRIDGSFGALTEAAVRAFQSGRGLNPDGIVGPRTWAELTG
ncbi:hypothetical protein NUACC21_42090 [Scytonema sp. NUACC21]